MADSENRELSGPIVHQIWNVTHILRRISDGRAGQKRILTILLRNENITQSELTAHLGIQPGSASEILSKLEGAGLIRRVENQSDRRTVRIELTARGRREAEAAKAEKDDRKQELLSPLSTEEQEQLLRLLEKMNTAWAEHHEDPEKGRRLRG